MLSDILLTLIKMGAERLVFRKCICLALSECTTYSFKVLNSVSALEWNQTTMSTSPEQLNGSRTMPATSNSNLEENERPKKRQRHDQPAEPEAAPAQSTSAEPAAPFEPSYFGVAPNDEFTKEVGIWLWQWSRGQKNIEIEAKIGVLLEGSIRNQNVRLDFPVATESSMFISQLSRAWRVS